LTYQYNPVQDENGSSATQRNMHITALQHLAASKQPQTTNYPRAGGRSEIERIAPFLACHS